jgi:phosphatidylinositol alpha-mannosyltransferase
VDKFSDTKLFIAGPGNQEEAFEVINPNLRNRITFLGRISDKEKADFLTSVGLYVAPNTGGESFGIILAEAMASGASIVASDIPAFDALLGHGKYGTLFTSEDSTDLANKVIDLLSSPDARIAKARAGKEYAQTFDWDVVAEKIFDVYEMAMVGGKKVTLASENRSWNRLLGRD